MTPYKKMKKKASVLDLLKTGGHIVEWEPKFPPAEQTRLASALAFAQSSNMGTDVEDRIKHDFAKSMSQKAIFSAARVG